MFNTYFEATLKLCLSLDWAFRRFSKAEWEAYYNRFDAKTKETYENYKKIKAAHKNECAGIIKKAKLSRKEQTGK